MRYLLLCFVLFIATKTYAQCEVQEITQDDGVKVYYAGFEEMFTIAGRNNNGDFGEGGMVVFARVAAIGHDKSDWDLDAIVKIVGFTDIIPRRIILKFKNLNTLVLNSKSVHSDQGHRIYEYSIAPQQLNLLNHPLHSITIVDTRTNQQVSSNAKYHSTLVEQITCIKDY